MAMNFPSSLWDWYAKPENAHRGQRFAQAMKGNVERYPVEIFTTGKTSISYFITMPIDFLPSALDWAALKDDDVVVDVGGGTGGLTLLLSKSFPQLKYIVQDLVMVMPDAEKVVSLSFGIS
jgi:tRNA G46 methylase TrmB